MQGTSPSSPVTQAAEKRFACTTQIRTRRANDSNPFSDAPTSFEPHQPYQIHQTHPGANTNPLSSWPSTTAFRTLPTRAVRNGSREGKPVLNATAQEPTAPVVAVYPTDRVAIITLDTPSLREPIATNVARRLIALADPAGACHTRQAVALHTVRDATSAALAAFLRVSDHLASLDGKLVLFNVPDPIDDAIHLCGLVKRLPVAATEAEAVAMAEGRTRRLFGFARRAA